MVVEAAANPRLPLSMRNVAYLRLRAMGIRSALATGAGESRSEGEGHVILRVIRGRADRQKVTSLREALVARLGPGPAGTVGPDRFHLGIRPADDGVDVLILSCWRSAEAAAEGDARDLSPLRLAAAHLGEVEVGHFEIDMNLLRDADTQPVALRVATGRFLRSGGDIQMQQLLRQRLGSLGPEMIEAYVGRRLLGRAVDVAFVTTWRALPDGHELEVPLWPDISIQYDEFSVEVYGRVD